MKILKNTSAEGGCVTKEGVFVKLKNQHLKGFPKEMDEDGRLAKKTKPKQKDA